MLDMLILAEAGVAVESRVWAYALFIGLVAVFLALDLGVFHRHAPRCRCERPRGGRLCGCRWAWHSRRSCISRTSASGSVLVKGRRCTTRRRQPMPAPR